MLLAVDEEGEGGEWGIRQRLRWSAQLREEANREDEGIGKDEGWRRWCWGRARRVAGMELGMENEKSGGARETGGDRGS